MRILMKSCPDKQHTKKPFVNPTNVQTHRPCIDSLRIPNKFNRPCVMPHKAQTESASKTCCRNARTVQHPICHCFDQNASIAETCNSSTNSTRSSPPCSNYGFRRDANVHDNSIIKIKSNKADGYDADITCKDSGNDNQQDALEYTLNAEDNIHRSLVSFAPSCNQSINCRKSGRRGIPSVADQNNSNVIQNVDNLISSTPHVQNINESLKIASGNDFFQSFEIGTGSNNIYNNQLASSTRLTELSESRQDVNKIQTCVQNTEKNVLETNNTLSELNLHRENYNSAHTLCTSPPETNLASKILRNKNAQTSSSIRNTGYDSHQHYYNLPSGPSNRWDDNFEPVSNNSISFRSAENSVLPTNVQLQTSPSENMCQQCKMTPMPFAVERIVTPRTDTIEVPANELKTKTIQNPLKFNENNDQQNIRRDETDFINPYYVCGERELKGSSIFHSPLIHSDINARQTPFKSQSVENSYSKHNAQADIPSIQEQSHDDSGNHVEARLTTKDNISQNNSKSNALCGHRTDAQPTGAICSTSPDFSIFKEHLTFDNCSSPEPKVRSITSKLPSCSEQDDISKRFTPSPAKSSKVPVREKQFGMNENFSSSETRHGVGYCCHGVGTAATRDRRANETSFHKVTSDCECFDKTKRSQTRVDVVQGIQKGTCAPHKAGARSCASTTCTINRISGCPCRYPPAFQQFSCTGNISGCCNCDD